MENINQNINQAPEQIDNEWDILREKPASEEYLDILEELSSGVKGDEELGSHSIGVMIESAKDAANYEAHAHEMQRAAKIIDAEMIRRDSEKELKDATLELNNTPEGEREKREQLIAERDSAEERMNNAYAVARRELSEAYPDISTKEASRKFFGYESWATDPSGEQTIVQEGISTEQNPDDPERMEKINKAIELRSELHGPAYSDYLPEEIGVFKEEDYDAAA